MTYARYKLRHNSMIKKGLISGQVIAEQILERVKNQVVFLKNKNVQPRLAVILVGDHAPSIRYVTRKEKAAGEVGIGFDLVRLPADIDRATIINTIQTLQKNPALSGLIVQLPLPEPLYTSEVLNAIEPARDIDCLTDVNMGKLIMNTGWLTPPTAAAAFAIIKNQKIDVVGKNVAVIGLGALVGKPLSVMLMNARASVTTINSATPDTAAKCLAADIIVSGVGKTGLVRGNMVKPGALVIDAGVSFVDGVMHGDVMAKEISEHALVTPTPGGVGPITIAKLLENTVRCASRQHGLVLPE